MEGGNIARVEYGYRGGQWEEGERMRTKNSDP